MKVFKLEVEPHQVIVDLRTPEVARLVGIPFERLTSSDRNESERYGECRELAAEIEAADLGVAYPSPALADRFNVAYFGQTAEGWSSRVVSSEEPPDIDEGAINFIDP